MFFTLNRIEDNNSAVLTDDDGKVYSEELSLLPANCTVGDVFILKNGIYTFNSDETDARKQRIKRKKDDFFNKLKKKQEEI